MRNLELIYVCALLCSCAGKRIVIEKIERQDSIKENVKTIYIERIDTSYILLPQTIEKVVSKDTYSILENDYSLSEAQWVGGELHHTLETKLVKVPVPIKNIEKRKDSILYTSKTETKEIPILIEKKLSTFQKIEIYGFWILLSLLLLYLRNKIRLRK